MTDRDHEGVSFQPAPGGQFSTGVDNNAGEGKRMRSWNLPFLIRHSAFHAMDHAWEMEDKDLTALAE